MIPPKMPLDVTMTKKTRALSRLAFFYRYPEPSCQRVRVFGAELHSIGQEKPASPSIAPSHSPSHMRKRRITTCSQPSSSRRSSNCRNTKGPAPRNRSDRTFCVSKSTVVGRAQHPERPDLAGRERYGVPDIVNDLVQHCVRPSLVLPVNDAEYPSFRPFLVRLTS